MLLHLPLVVSRRARLTVSFEVMKKTAPPTVLAKLSLKVVLLIQQKGPFIQTAPPLPCSSLKLDAACPDVALLLCSVELVMIRKVDPSPAALSM